MTEPVVIAEYGAGQQVIRWAVYARHPASPGPVMAIEARTGDAWTTITAWEITADVGRRLRDLFVGLYG